MHGRGREFESRQPRWLLDIYPKNFIICLAMGLAEFGEGFSLKMSLQAHHLGTWTDENRGVSSTGDIDRICLARDFKPSFEQMLASVDGKEHPELSTRFKKASHWIIPTLGSETVRVRLAYGGVIDLESDMEATIKPLESIVRFLEALDTHTLTSLDGDTQALAQKSLVALTQPDVDLI